MKKTPGWKICDIWENNGGYGTTLPFMLWAEHIIRGTTMNKGNALKLLVELSDKEELYLFRCHIVRELVFSTCADENLFSIGGITFEDYSSIFTIDKRDFIECKSCGEFLPKEPFPSLKYLKQIVDSYKCDWSSSKISKNHSGLWDEFGVDELEAIEDLKEYYDAK